MKVSSGEVVTIYPSLKTVLIGMLTGFVVLFVSVLQVRAEKSISERVMHYRAIDSVVWAMPLLNFKTFRDGHKAIGVDYNDIAYHSRIQNWKYQATTPNSTTPYIDFFWNVKDGLVVIEIPPSADGSAYSAP